MVRSPSVVAVGFRELDDEIHRDRVPTLRWGLGRVQLTDWELPERFGSAAQITGCNVPADVTGHLGPPVVPGGELQHLEATGMTGEPGVVVLLQNPTAEVFVPRNNNLTAEVEQPSVNMPLGGPGRACTPNLKDLPS